MNRDDQVEDLLDVWEEAQNRGDQLTPLELCRDTPELLPELERRLAILSRFDALRTESVDREPWTVGRERHRASSPPREPVFTVHGPRFTVHGFGLPAVGQDFGGYRLVAELGHGGMGCVYRATDPLLRRDVALKLMRPDLVGRKETHERFLREARALAAVRHDHVVEVYQVGEAEGIPFLAMPLLEGETLASCLKREKTLPPTEVLRIGREMAEGLAAAHAKGMIHRDIKPANVWLEAGTNRVKLLDFGLVREQDAPSELTGEWTTLGTPAYMSPEQVEGVALDARSDLFSIGSVLYECATGQRPFSGATQMAVMKAVEKKQQPAARAVNPGVPVALSDLIDALLHKVRDQRPASAVELARRLRLLEAGGAADAPPAVQEMTATKEFQPARRRRWPWLVAAACGLVLIALGGVAVYKGLFARPPVDKAPSSIVLGPDTSVSTRLGPDTSISTRTGPDASATTRPGLDIQVKPPAAAPLRVLKIDVQHFARKGQDDADPRGLLGERSFATTLGDQVTVEAKLSRPAYAYLIAFRPDGMVELCFPASEDEPPSPTDGPRYPPLGKRDVCYGLSDGAGLMVFAVLASDRPLPPFREWAAKNRAEWQPAEGKAGEVWWDDGDLLDTLTPAGPAKGDRSKGEKALGRSAAVVALTDSLKKPRPTAAVGCIGFVVRKP